MHDQVVHVHSFHDRLTIAFVPTDRAYHAIASRSAVVVSTNRFAEKEESNRLFVLKNFICRSNRLIDNWSIILVDIIVDLNDIVRMSIDSAFQ